MPKITSNGGRDYLQCCLSGDLPENQGPANSRELRLVRLTGDGGVLGAYDFHSVQQVTFDERGRPVHIQDYGFASGVDDYQEGSAERAAEAMRNTLHEAIAATYKPVIDLSDK